MGSADVIPGVSGGTIALITGIYEDLIEALRSFDMNVVQKILAVDIKGALAKVHIRFLLALFSGIIVAILSLARLMNYLLHYHPVPTWSLFSVSSWPRSWWSANRSATGLAKPVSVLLPASLRLPLLST